MTSKWDARFFKMAQSVAEWSKDPDAQVGTVIVSPDRRQVAWGFNGFPIGVKDSEDRLNDTATKLEITVHAELNAILNSRRDVSLWTLYCTHHPCHECAKAIVQAGITRVVSAPPKGEDSKWCMSHRNACHLFREVGIETTWILDEGHHAAKMEPYRA